MALVLTEPFNNFTDAPWTNSFFSIVAGRTGTGAQNGGASSCLYSIPAPSRTNTFTVGFAYRLTVVGSLTRPVLRWELGASSVQLTLNVTPTGALEVVRFGGGIILGTSAAGLMTNNVWRYIEMGVVFHDTAGALEVRVDGVPVIGPLTGIDTLATGGGTVDALTLVNPASGSVCIFDDLYLRNDSVFQGDPRSGGDAQLARVATRVLTSGTPAANVARVSTRILASSSIAAESRIAQVALRALVSLVVPPPTGGIVKTWTGTAFVNAPVRVWTGSEFVDAVAVRVWDGNTFVDTA